jgi:hypothetical protein
MIRLTSLVSPQVLGKPVNSKTSVVKENEEPEQNVANGLPQTQGDDKITMTRESLKNIVREVMKEEGEYQKIFHKLLNKFGFNLQVGKVKTKDVFFGLKQVWVVENLTPKSIVV